MKKKNKKIAKKVAKRKPAKRKPVRKPKKPVRRPAKKAARKTKAKKAAPARKAEKPLGQVTHFYNQIKVAIVKFAKPVRTGTLVRYKGATTDFAEAIGSMQFDHKPIATAPKGKLVGIRVRKRVRQGDSVYLEKR